VVYFTGLSEGRFWSSHVLLPLASVLVGTLVYHLVYLAALAAAGHTVSWLPSLSQVTLPTVLLNTLLMLPVYQLMRWLQAVLHPAVVRT
jgi:hypothetical protein